MIDVDGTEFPKRVVFRVTPMLHPNDFMNLEIVEFKAPRRLGPRWPSDKSMRWTRPVYLVRLVNSGSYFTRHNSFSAAYAAAWRRCSRFDASGIHARRRAKRVVVVRKAA